MASPNYGFNLARDIAFTLAQDGEALIVLLCGGDKSAQAADIQTAKRYWQDYQRRKAHAL